MLVDPQGLATTAEWGLRSQIERPDLGFFKEHLGPIL